MNLKSALATALATAFITGGTAVAASNMGAAPREVNLNVPCQRANQLNCSWYGESYSPGTSETPPVYTQTFWYNYAEPNGQTFCRYRLVPVRKLTCADHWPLTTADEFGTNK